MADEFAEYIYGTKVRTSEDERVWGLTPQSERRERVVRCRDCSHATPCPLVNSEKLICELLDEMLVSPRDFCSWGEGREA